MPEKQPARPPKQAGLPPQRRPQPHRVNKERAPFLPHTNGKPHLAKHFLQAPPKK